MAGIEIDTVDLTGKDANDLSHRKRSKLRTSEHGEGTASCAIDLTAEMEHRPASLQAIKAKKSKKRSRAAPGPGTLSHSAEEQTIMCNDSASKGRTGDPVIVTQTGEKKKGKDPGAKRKAKEQSETRKNANGRTIPLSKQPSKQTRDRMERAMPGSGHRMYVLSQHTVAPLTAEGGPVRKYALLGATGNVYNVVIGRHPSCDCPDAAKGNLCKHHLFIMLRVLRLATNDYRVWQRALLPSEAVEVLSGNSSTRDLDGGTFASESLQSAYRAASGLPSKSEASPSQQPERPVEGECPICFDDLTDGGNGSTAEKAIDTCRTCRQHMHQECFAKWASSRRGVALTCVYCRSPWHYDAAAAGSAASAGPPGSKEYINLASQSEEHGDQTLHDLYGSNAHWIRYHQGRGGSRSTAARLWNLAQ